MKRGEWHAEAREMAAQGMPTSAIAAHFGVNSSSVRKALNPERAKEWARRSEARPERRAAKRQWEREHDRGICEICGALTGKRKFKRCKRHQYKTDVAWRRRKVIADMWAAGMSYAEITAALGITSNTLSTLMVDMRRKGWDLPYRYNVQNGRRVAA